METSGFPDPKSKKVLLEIRSRPTTIASPCPPRTRKPRGHRDFPESPFSGYGRRISVEMEPHRRRMDINEGTQGKSGKRRKIRDNDKERNEQMCAKEDTMHCNIANSLGKRSGGMRKLPHFPQTRRGSTVSMLAFWQTGFELILLLFPQCFAMPAENGKQIENRKETR